MNVHHVQVSHELEHQDREEGDGGGHEDVGLVRVPEQRPGLSAALHGHGLTTGDYATLAT